MLLVSPLSALAAEPASPSYERDIRPLLSRRCTTCHNTGKKEVYDVSGGLALDSYESILAGTGRHKVVVAGKSTESELAKRLTDPDEDRRMPLSEEPLRSSDQAVIRRWIDAGLPRGTVPAAAKMEKPSETTEPSIANPRRPIRWRRTLDVSIPLDLKLPDGIEGIKKGGPIRIVARVGPLPPVSALAFRGDGRLLAAGTYGQVVLWDVVEARPMTTIGELPGPIHTLGFSRDGRSLAVGSGIPGRTGIVRIYAVPGGELLREFSGHGDVVFGLAFRPDGGQLASASFDQTIRLWNLATGQPDGIFRGHSDFVEAIMYSKDGRSIFSAGKDRTIKRIDTRTLKELRTYSGHDDDVLSLAMHPDGLRFVSSGNEPQLRWWNLDSNQPAKSQGGHTGPVQQLAFSRDGRRLISTSGDGSTRIWNGANGAPLRSLKGTSEWQYSAAISDDGQLAAAGGWDGLIHLWDVESGKPRGTLVQVPVNASDLKASPPVDWLALTPDGTFFGSSAILKIVRGQVGDLTISDALLRSACVNPERTSRAIRGEPVPPIKFVLPGKS